MNTQEKSNHTPNLPGPEAVDAQPSSTTGELYEIHIRGHLNRNWSDYLEGLEMRWLDNGEMVLFGYIVDQAALMGILHKLNRLNLTILSFNPMTEKEMRKK